MKSGIQKTRKGDSSHHQAAAGGAGARHKAKKGGFDYHLEQDVIDRYRAKPVELRLKWLYHAALFRKHYPKRIVRVQDRFREGSL